MKAGKCINIAKVCDGNPECPGGIDEDKDYCGTIIYYFMNNLLIVNIYQLGFQLLEN
jgi:hypothetical protein